jgi:hypothetical protein
VDNVIEALRIVRERAPTRDEVARTTPISAPSAGPIEGSGAHRAGRANTLIFPQSASGILIQAGREVGRRGRASPFLQGLGETRQRSSRRCLQTMFYTAVVISVQFCREKGKPRVTARASREDGSKSCITIRRQISGDARRGWIDRSNHIPLVIHPSPRCSAHRRSYLKANPVARLCLTFLPWDLQAVISYLRPGIRQNETVWCRLITTWLCTRMVP